MREDRILAKLAGLLYIALLVILGISPARILLATESGEVTTVKPVEALKEVEVSFEAGTFSSGTPFATAPGQLSFPYRKTARSCSMTSCFFFAIARRTRSARP